MEWSVEVVGDDSVLRRLCEACVSPEVTICVGGARKEPNMAAVVWGQCKNRPKKDRALLWISRRLLLPHNIYPKNAEMA